MEMSQFLLYPILLFLTSIPGNSEPICEFDRTCLPIYTSLKSIFEDTPSDYETLCPMAHDLKDCMKKASRKCRGDLNYHFFEKLVRDLNSHVGVGKHCLVPRTSEESNKSTPSSSSSSSSHEISHHNHHGRGRGRARGHHRNSHGHLSGVAASEKCQPFSSVNDSSDSVGCALFGLTNLKGFSDPFNFTEINYCSLAGAWSLIDTPEFGVQITNKDGLSPLPKDITATTLVTVMVKSGPCSEHKVYQATFDEVPAMFSDGSSSTGTVTIDPVVESEHVKIHFPHLGVTIDVIKVIDKIPIPSLAVTIKVPQASVSSFMSDPKSLRGLPLCFYGCPRTATMKPSQGSRDREGATNTMSARSTSTSATTVSSNYYKSRCPHPMEEVPQGDQGDRKEEHERGGPIRFTNTDFGGQRSERSSIVSENAGGDSSASSSTSSSSAVICASLRQVYRALEGTQVAPIHLPFPGEDPNSFSFSSAALTSVSSPVKFHFVFVIFSVITVFLWS